MTKKDYIKFARAFAFTCPLRTSPAYPQWRVDISAVADVCAADNPRFNRERFLAAAYADAETVSQSSFQDTSWPAK